jgi:hypothetical protein
MSSRSNSNFATKSISEWSAHVALIPKDDRIDSRAPGKLLLKIRPGKIVVNQKNNIQHKINLLS